MASDTEKRIIPNTNTTVVINQTGVSSMTSQVENKTNELLENTNPETIMVPSYIEMREDGVYIIFEELTQPDDFKKSLDSWFSNNMYIEWIDIKRIERILFEQWEHTGELKIWSALKAIPEDLLGIFWESIQVWKDGKARWNYFFRREIATDDVYIGIMKDMVIAQAWKTGRTRPAIRYGFIGENIITWLQKKSNATMIIAEPKNSTTWEDATVQEIFPTKRNGQLSENEHDRRWLDEWHLNQREVLEWEVLYKKIPALPGKSGMDVSGLVTLWTPGKDIFFPRFNTETLIIEKQVDGSELLKARRAWFVYREKNEPIDIRPDITVKSVGMRDTHWSISLHKNTGDVKWDIEKPIKSAYKVTTWGSILNTNVKADTDIIVACSILGNTKAFISESSWRVVLHETWRAEAGWDITVWKNIENAYIWNPSGRLTFENKLVGSHVYSNEVIGKSARGSLIIANTVQLHDAEDCIIITNNAHIAYPKNNVYIVTVIPNITEDTERLTKEITVLEKKLKWQDDQYKGKVVEIGRSIKWPHITPQDLAQIGALVSQMAPIFLKNTLTPEESQRKAKFISSPLRTLIPLYNSLKELKEELQEKRDLLNHTQSIPENVLGSLSIQLDHIDGENNILHVLQYSLPVQEDFRIQWEEKQQAFTQNIRNLTGKRYPISWWHFSLKWWE